jgi:hypothetical protein
MGNKNIGERFIHVFLLYMYKLDLVNGVLPY